MTDSLIVEGLSKRYVIRTETEDKKKNDAAPQARSLVDRIRGAFTPSAMSTQATEFWALKDVSFRVAPGTILGVIGANGAGKTTLLKVIARVIQPTAGRVSGVGRVVSLLEMGAGFDPDFSARENILMNAAMLGVPRTEALHRIDDILDFAEVDRFSETPLKHFSSGMYLRLAFATAIRMRPRILLADEILAVGDAGFQERCLRTVEEGGRNGLTVLFVSHDMEAIVRVCNRVIWVNGGQIVKDGDPDEVVDEYQNATWSRADASRDEKGRHANRLAEILAVRLIASDGREIGGAPIEEDVYIRIRVKTMKLGLAVRATVDVTTRGQLLLRSADAEERLMERPGVYDLVAKVPAHFLAEANYAVTVSCIIKKDDDHKEFPLVTYNALSFMAYSNNRDSLTTKRMSQRVPLIAPRLDWEVRLIDEESR